MALWDFHHCMFFKVGIEKWYRMSVCHRRVLQATVAYYLMLDNRRRISNGYLGAEFQEGRVS